MPNTHEQLPNRQGCIGENILNSNNNNYSTKTVTYNIFNPCNNKEIFTYNKHIFNGPKNTRMYSAEKYKNLFFPKRTIMNKLRPKGAKGFYLVALINNIPIELKLDEGSTNTSMGINHAKILGLDKLIVKPANAEAVGSNIEILGKLVVDIKINEYLTPQVKIDVLNTDSKYILLSNKHQMMMGITKDPKTQQILINEQPIINQHVILSKPNRANSTRCTNGTGDASLRDTGGYTARSYTTFGNTLSDHPEVFLIHQPLSRSDFDSTAPKNQIVKRDNKRCKAPNVSKDTPQTNIHLKNNNDLLNNQRWPLSLLPKRCKAPNVSRNNLEKDVTPTNV